MFINPKTFLILKATTILLLPTMLTGGFGFVTSQLTFYKILGEPEELGWLLFELATISATLVFGLLGSLLGVLLIIVSKRVLFVGYNKLLGLIVPSYLLMVLVILTIIILAGILIPPCANCVR